MCSSPSVANNAPQFAGTTELEKGWGLWTELDGSMCIAASALTWRQLSSPFPPFGCAGCCYGWCCSGIPVLQA